MKKKKEMINTNRLIVIILGVITLIVLIVGFSFGWDVFDKDKFTIYKQECWNKTIPANYIFPQDFEEVDCPNFINEIICYLSKDKQVILSSKINPNSIGGINFTFYPISNNIFYETKEICEFVEVDEIIIGDCDETHFSCWVMDKEGVNSEWLDEICECVKCFYKKTIFDKPYDSYWRISEMEGFDENCNEDKNGECSKYKCRDYLVEVK